jgi:hypothetical protein
MSRFVQDLETLLDQLVAEHKKLLGYVQQQTAAMKEMDLPAMEAARTQQEACRQRIRQIDHRRRGTVQQLSRLHKLSDELTLTQISELYPQNAAALTKKRDVLKRLAAEIALKTNVAGQLAGAVLGHLNTAVKLIASAVQHAGVYTKSGIPKVAPRIGALEAVG